MPPPELPADAPRPDAPHPIQVDLAPAGRHEPDPAVFDGLDGGSCQALHIHEPLQRKERLDGGAAPITRTDRMVVVFGFNEEAVPLQPLDDRLPGLGGGQPGEVAGLFGHEPVRPDHRHAGQTVPQTDLPVVGVVSRGDLQGAGAEADIHMLIGDDRDLAPYHRHHGGLTDEPPVTRVLGIDGHGRVTEDGLGTSGRHSQRLSGAGHRVADIVQF